MFEENSNETATIITIQLIISLMVMPVTPVLWICGAGRMTSLVQRMARMSPAAWSMFFAVTMPGATTSVLDLTSKMLLPHDFINTMITLLIAALGVLWAGVGSYCITRVCRWGRPPDYAIDSSVRSPSEAEVREDVMKAMDPEELKNVENWITSPSTRRIAFDASMALLESILVEAGWRIYLLPRLLFALAPSISILAMSLLSTLSSMPAILYVVCSDTPIIIRHVDTKNPSEKRLFFRDPPPASSTALHAIHLFLQNVALGMLIMYSNFCIWPAVCISFYWSFVSYHISGRMLISTYLPLGMESLAETNVAQSRRMPSAWVRGPAWKVSCEGTAGVLAMLLLLVGPFIHLDMTWKRDALKG